MKKEDLTKIGLNDEQVKEVFKLNGIDINAEKSKADAAAADLKNVRDQLSTTQSQLKELQEMDPAKLQEEIGRLNETLTNQKAEFEKQIADRDFSDAVNSAISAAGGRNAKTIRPLLDEATLKASKNQKDDIAAAIAKIKEENAYLFSDGNAGNDRSEPIQNPVAGTGGRAAKNIADTNAVRRIMGLPEIKDN